MREPELKGDATWPLRSIFSRHRVDSCRVRHYFLRPGAVGVAGRRRLVSDRRLSQRFARRLTLEGSDLGLVAAEQLVETALDAQLRRAQHRVGGLIAGLFDAAR